MNTPTWMKTPSVPGMWLSLSSNPHAGYVALDLRQSDLDRGAPFYSQQVFGPIPSPVIEPPVVLPSNVIEWHVQEDVLGNTYWEGDSPFSEDSVPFQWRLRRRLRSDDVVTFADHDSELMPHNGPAEWATIGDAQAAIQNIHDEIIQRQRQHTSPDK